MSTVLAISAKIKSGKSTLASAFAKEMGWPYVSFGDYVRSVVKQRGLKETREVQQDVGDELIRKDLEGFCRSVLAQVEWKPGQPLVIEGIRHTEVNNLLRRMVAPSKYVLAYIRVDDQTRKERLRKEGISNHELVNIEAHPTEEQVKTVLPHVANYILDGTESIPVLIDKLKAISTNEPSETGLSIPSARVMEIVEKALHLTLAEQREVIARLWPETEIRSGDRVWRSFRFSDTMRVVAYAPEQEPYIEELRDALLRGVLARLENESDGSYEVYGPDRTYYVIITPARQFVALLSSWLPDRAPREVTLRDSE